MALGPTRAAFISDATLQAPTLEVDEVWAVNTAIRWLRHDLAWIMDDMLEYATHFPAYGELMRQADRPIITSVAYPEFPKAIAYPLEAILNSGITRYYFNNSLPYMLAYANMLRVAQLYLFGADYTFPGVKAREDGRGCVEYWIGWAEAQGMEVGIAANSTLCDTAKGLCFYGYLRQPVITMHDGPGTIDRIIRPTSDVLSTYKGATEKELDGTH